MAKQVRQRKRKERRKRCLVAFIAGAFMMMVGFWSGGIRGGYASRTENESAEAKYWENDGRTEGTEAGHAQSGQEETYTMILKGQELLKQLDDCGVGKNDRSERWVEGITIMAENATLPWNLILVNAEHVLPEDFTVELTRLRNGQAVDQRAYQDLQEMLDAARAIGLLPLICSSYRTEEKQEMLFKNKVAAYTVQGYSLEQARTEAARWVAAPGTSEHQTGLAVDIVAASYQLLDEEQENTAEQKWLMEHSWEYGFVLRYPADKSEITGVGYEPWHYRYVGKEAAGEMYGQGLCLEEYLQEMQ